MRKFSLPKVSKEERIETLDEEEARKYEKEGYKRLYSHRFGKKIVLKREKKEWVIFEDEIRSFLSGIGFQDIESGYLGEYKVNVYGGFGKTFLVIDCTMKEESGFKPIRQKILGTAGKKRDIKTAIQQKFKGKYKETKFIIATKGIEIEREDEKLARKFKIVIWDERYFDMNKKLFKSIGPLVAHWILRELETKPEKIPDDKKTCWDISAFKIRSDDRFSFNFLIDAYLLANAGYVSRILAEKGGYQRVLYSGKVNAIARFIKDGGSFPNNIIINCKELKFFPKKQLSKNVTFGVIKIPKRYASIEIVDGQHRVYGIWKSGAEGKILNITAFTDLRRGDQADMYVTINRTQKPVEANEIWSLYPITAPFSREAWVCTVTKKLNEKGILKRRIYIPGISSMPKKSYSLYLANLCDGIVKHSKLLNYFDIEDERIRIKIFEQTSKGAHDILNGFFKFVFGVGKSVSEKWKKFIFSNNGSVVLLRLLGYLLDYVPQQFYKIKRGDVKGVHKKLSLLEEGLKNFYSGNIDKADELIKTTSSEGGRVEAAERIGVIIANFNPGYGGEGVKKRIKTPEYLILDKLEKTLRNCIIDAISKVQKNWEDRIPQTIRERAEQLKKEEMEKKLPRRENLLCYINFSEYKVIIYENWDIFKSVFADKRYAHKVEELEPARNALRHTGRALTSDEKTKLDLYSREIQEKIEEWKRFQLTE